PPSGTPEYWYRPASASYIQAVSNDNIRAYDSGESYGFYFDGSTNQWGGYFRTSSATDPTAAVVGYSDVSGMNTYGYLGYNGTWTAPTSGFDGEFGSIYGSAVYGVVDDPERASGFFRTTGSASYASAISYSDVWIAGYFKSDFVDDFYASRPTLYGHMNTHVDQTGMQPAVKGYSEYHGGTLLNSGITVGGEFYALGNEQDAIAVYGEATGDGYNVGIYGYAFGGLTNYAGYFEGDVHITGNLTVDGTYPGGAGGGDNLGDHTATMDLDMNGYDIDMYWGGSIYDYYGSYGSTGQVLKSNGTYVYWAADETGGGSGGTACDHEIWLYDSYGDGWNGAAVDVLVNGIVVLDNITLSSGAGPGVFAFSAATGDAIQVQWVAEGSYSYECSFNVYDGTGAALVTGWLYTNGTWNGTGNCGSRSGGGSSDDVAYGEGSGRLVDGVVTIEFRDDYIGELRGRTPKVVVTPTEPCGVLYVAEKDATSFTVREHHGVSNASFDWIAVAKDNPVDSEVTHERPTIDPEYRALKGSFIENPEVHSFSEWKDMFEEAGYEFIGEEEYRKQIEKHREKGSIE
ncbi:MAG: hypothetical protein ACP5G4_10105, partial [bacterium]